jgi:hypothetical protein
VEIKGALAGSAPRSGIVDSEDVRLNNIVFLFRAQRI